MGGVGEGDVKDGRAVYEGVDGLVVVGAWEFFYVSGTFWIRGK